MGPFASVLTEPRAFASAVPCRGMLGLWSVPVDLHARVAELDAAARDAR
jgi:hypothetical protein